MSYTLSVITDGWLLEVKGERKTDQNGKETPFPSFTILWDRWSESTLCPFPTPFLTVPKTFSVKSDYSLAVHYLLRGKKQRRDETYD